MTTEMPYTRTRQFLEDVREVLNAVDGIDAADTFDSEASHPDTATDTARGARYRLLVPRTEADPQMRNQKESVGRASAEAWFLLTHEIVVEVVWALRPHDHPATLDAVLDAEGRIIVALMSEKLRGGRDLSYRETRRDLDTARDRLTIEMTFAVLANFP